MLNVLSGARARAAGGTIRAGSPASRIPGGVEHREPEPPGKPPEVCCAWCGRRPGDATWEADDWDSGEGLLNIDAGLLESDDKWIHEWSVPGMA